MLGADEPASARISSMLAVPVRSRNFMMRSERELSVDIRTRMILKKTGSDYFTLPLPSSASAGNRQKF